VAPVPKTERRQVQRSKPKEDRALTCPDIAEILQNQIITALKSRKVASEPFQRPQIPDFDLYMDALEKIAAEAEVRSER